MNQSDMNERGLAKGDLVDITSHHEGHTRKAEQFTVIPYPIPRTCVATYFPKANVFVPIDSVTDKRNTSTSKSVVVTVHLLVSSIREKIKENVNFSKSLYLI